MVKNLPSIAGDPGLIPESEGLPGEVNGNPLQYSCLENSMDRGPLWATVHGIVKSQIWLSDQHYYYYYWHFRIKLYDPESNLQLYQVPPLPAEVHLTLWLPPRPLPDSVSDWPSYPLGPSDAIMLLVEPQVSVELSIRACLISFYSLPEHKEVTLIPGDVPTVFFHVNLRSPGCRVQACTKLPENKLLFRHYPALYWRTWKALSLGTEFWLLLSPRLPRYIMIIILLHQHLLSKPPGEQKTTREIEMEKSKTQKSWRKHLHTQRGHMGRSGRTWAHAFTGVHGWNALRFPDEHQIGHCKPKWGLVSSMGVLAKGRLGEGPRQPGETRADEWVQGPFRSWHVHVTLWAAFHSICMHEGVNVSLRFRQAAWPNRMDAEAVIPWSNLAEFLTQRLVSWVNNGTVSSPWVSGSAETLDGSLIDRDHH